MHSKGVTPVISVILLLLISISLIGAVYVFFIEQSDVLTKSVSEDTQNTITALNTKARISLIDPANGKFYMRNTGTKAIEIEHLTVFVDNVIVDGSWKNIQGQAITKIPVGDTVYFQASAVGAFAGCTSIKVDTPGQSPSANC